VLRERWIKLHKAQLASDRTSCHSPVADQVRLVLHTATYWLMLTLRDAIPAASPLAKAEFVTIRSKLIKIAARSASRKPFPDRRGACPFCEPIPKNSQHVARQGGLSCRPSGRTGSLCMLAQPLAKPPPLMHGSG
jgi:hypothetical protein